MLKEDNLEDEIKNLGHQGSAESRQRIWAEVRRALDEQQQQAAGEQPQIWRDIMQSRMIKYGAAAVIVIGVLVIVSVMGGSPDGAGVAWAEVVEAFNNVQEVQGVANNVMQDGSAVTYTVGIRKPDCIYEDKNNSIKIDNGQERLILFKDKKEAVFFPTMKDKYPVTDHEIFKVIGVFQNEPLDGITITRLEEESDEATLVFSVVCDRPEVTWVGKAWIDAATNLPIKVTTELTSTPINSQMFVSGEAVFCYDPIDEDVFALTVPEGYVIK